MDMASSEGSDFIPGLPNDAAKLCLAKVPRAELLKLSCVCKSWKLLLASEEFSKLRSKIGAAEAWLFVLTEKPRGALFKAYCPRSDRWFALPPIPGMSNDASLWQGFACVALGSSLFLMGGMHQSLDTTAQAYTPGVVLADVCVYNSCTNQWSQVANMNTPRSWFAATVMGDCIYVAGGQGRNCFLNSVEVYDSKHNSWTYVSSMTHVRSSCYGLALHDEFWVIGGEVVRHQHSGKPVKSSAEVYDRRNALWRLIPDMWLDTQKVPGPSTAHCEKLLFVHNDKLVIYEEDSNTWNHVGCIPGEVSGKLSRFGFAFESIGDELYVVAGMRITKQHRFSAQYLNTTEVCTLSPSQGQGTSISWRSVAGLGECEGNVVASAVVTL